MARERMTQRLSADKALVAIDAFEQKIIAAFGKVAEETEETDTEVVAGTDEELESWTNDIAKEERAVAEDSTGISTDDEGDQNAKSMDNWPTNASTELADELSEGERTALATELTALSKGMAQRMANGGLKQKDREFVAKRLLAAAKRIASPTVTPNK